MTPSGSRTGIDGNPSQITSSMSTSRLGTSCAALAGLGVLLLLHRYAGINHDSSLYLGQVLHQLHPGIFDRDLFFAFGSQESFTLLPRLIAGLHRVASLPSIFLWCSLLGLLFFWAAAWLYLSRLLPREQAYWAWIAALALPAGYGLTLVFSYGEPFLTARASAEALCLLSLASLSRGRLPLAALCLAIAGMMHPLQAIGAAFIAGTWLILHDRRWLHLGWLALPVLALGFSAIKPFNGMYQVLDTQWLKDLTDITRQLFITQWYPEDWSNTAYGALVLSYAAWHLRGAFGRWCLAALLGLISGFIASLILVDLLHLALPAALQLWRVQWVAQLLANAAVGTLLFRDLVEDRQPARACLLGTAAVMAASGFLWTWGLVFALYLAWPRLSARFTRGFQKAVAAIACILMLGLLAFYTANEWLTFRIAHYRLDWYAIDRRILAFPVLALGLPLLGAWLWRRSHSTLLRPALLAIALLMVAAGALRWDARSPIALAVESNPERPDLFGTTIPEDAQVFWVDDAYAATWIALQRADYFHLRQLAGSVFNRGTPREGRLRMERMRPVIEEHMYCQDRSVPAEQRADCRIDSNTLYQACQPAVPQPPDYLVLPYRQDVRAEGQWSIEDPATGETVITYWLYSCRQVLESLAPASPSTLPGASQ